MGSLKRLAHAPIRLRGTLLDGGARRPLLTAGSTAFVLGGIDASGKQRLELGIDARTSERALDERVEAECREVALVEHDRMSQIDRPVVVSVLFDQVEQ